MTPDARHRLEVAAERYLQAEPWQKISADDEVGLHDRGTGLFGRAVIRGPRHGCGLSVFLGEEGFALIEQRSEGELDASLFKSRVDALAFTITSRGRAVVRESEMAIHPRWVQTPAPGHLVAFRCEPNRLGRSLETAEAMALARFLMVTAELAERDLVPRDSARCPSDHRLMYEVDEHEQGLTFRRRWRARVPVDLSYPRLELSPELLSRLRALPRVEGRYLASVFTPRVYRRHREGGELWTGMVVDPHHPHVPILLEFGKDFTTVVSRVFTEWGEGQHPLGGVLGLPRELWVDSFPVYRALESAAADLGIRLMSQDRQPQLQEAKEVMVAMMFSGDLDGLSPEQ